MGLAVRANLARCCRRSTKGENFQMSESFETWSKESEPWLLDEPTDDADKRAKSAARQAWTDSGVQMQDQCAEVCRRAAQAYESRGRHSGPGWQVSVYLEREIRALATAGQQEVGTQAGASEQVPTDATKEHEDLRTLLVEICGVLNCFKSKGAIGCAPQSPVTPATNPPAGATPSPIRDDSRFLAFWVMAWMPLMCALFLVVSPYLASSGEMLVTGAYFIFVYVMFAPALYRLFIGGLRHRDRGS
jgi:hypothetical protein